MDQDSNVRGLDGPKKGADEGPGNTPCDSTDLPKADEGLLAEQRLRKQDEERLGNFERHFEITENLAHLGSWEWDIAADKVSWSAGLYRVFGLVPNEFEATREAYLERVHPDDRSRVADQIANALHKLEPFESYGRIVRKDGTVRVLHSRGEVVSDEAGHPIRMFGTCQDVTEREASVDALYESKERYRMLFDNASDLVFAADLSGRITSLNRAAEKATGYRLEEAQTTRWMDAIAPEYRALAQEMFAQKLGGGGSTRYELEVIAKDGRRLHLEMSTHLIYQDGVPIGVQGIARDISERKRAEDERKAHAVRNEALVQALGEIVYDWRPQEDQVIWRGSFLEILGYTTDELGSNTESWTSRVHPDDLRLVQDGIHQATQGRRLFDCEYRFRQKDGTYCWMHDRGIPFLDESGALTRMVGVFRDITERRQMQSLLEGEKRILELIAMDASLPRILDMLCRTLEEQVPGSIVCVLLFDEKRHNLYHGAAPSLPESYVRAVDDKIAIGPSSGSCGTAAYRREEVIVSDIAADPLWADYRALGLSQGLRACWSKPILSARNGLLGTFATYWREVRSPQTKDRWLLDRGAHLARIVIEHAKVMEDLRQLYAYLLEMEERERRRMALELHEGTAQSLTALTMNLSLLRRAGRNQRKQQKILSESLDLAKQCLREIRTISQLFYPPNFEGTGIVPALRVYVKGFSKRSGIKVRLQAPSNLLGLTREIEMVLFRVVQECLSNVHRHSGSRRAFVSLVQGDDTVKLDVMDAGRGMPARVLAEVTSRGGGGVGLAGMRERVRQLGGEFEIHSRGKGLKVSATFPFVGANP